MGLVQRKWVVKAKAELQKALGGRCQLCDCKVDLQFTTLIKQDYSGKSWETRVSAYRQQHKRHNLLLFCFPCRMNFERNGTAQIISLVA